MKHVCTDKTGMSDRVGVLSLLKYLNKEIEIAFKEHPYGFFTEHDIHSKLSLIASRILTEEGALYAETNEGIAVSRVHHEYPTPFRCHMKGSQFRAITEVEFREQRKRNPRFRARRGYFDFVIFNSNYISSCCLRVVSGKRYRYLLDSLKDQQHPALDLALEVVYYPVFDERPHFGMMKRRIDSAIQDYKKLTALMEFAYQDNEPFCKEAAMMLFSNTTYKSKLEKMLSYIPTNEKVSFFSILH